MSLQDKAIQAAKAAIFATPDSHLTSRDMLIHMVTQALTAAIPAPPANASIPSAKTPAEILDGLQLPHTPDLLTAVGAACDDHAQFRQQVRERVQSVVEHSKKLDETAQKIGAQNIADVTRLFFDMKDKHRKTSDLLQQTQHALLAANQYLDPEQHRFLVAHHGPALRQAHGTKGAHAFAAQLRRSTLPPMVKKKSDPGP